MKPVETAFSAPQAGLNGLKGLEGLQGLEGLKGLDGLDAPLLAGRGWSVFVEALTVPVRIGIHPHEHEAAQPVVIDARLGYRREPREETEWIDYESYCTRVAAYLAHKPHTRLLETLVADLAELSFREWPALDTLTLAVHKPKIRPGTQRVGVELEWTRADYLRRGGRPD